MDVSVIALFFPVLLLNQRWSPPLRFQASHCSTFRIMCDVSSTAVFCSESIECFPGTVPKFFLELLVTIPMAPIITGAIVHFRFLIRCISIHKRLYSNFFSASLLLLLQECKCTNVVHSNQYTTPPTHHPHVGLNFATSLHQVSLRKC